MPFRFRNNRLTPIGINMGGEHVRLLQLTAGPDPQVVAAASRAVPADVRHDPHELVAYQSRAVSELYREGGFTGRSATVSIPAAAMFVQHLRLNRAEGTDADRQVFEHLQEALGVDPSHLVVRQVDVGDAESDGASRREVICMATARRQIMHYVAMLKQARLRVAGVHGEPSAINAAYADRFRRADDDHHMTMYVDIGAAGTKVVIAHGAHMVFAKMISVGGDQLDRQFAEQLQVDVSEARDRRRRQAGTWTKSADGADDHADMSSDALAMAASRRTGVATLEASAPQPETIAAEGEMLDCLIDELRLCVGYHSSLFVNRPIERVVFLGGEANQATMCRRIAETLGVPGELGDPLGALTRASDARPPVGVDLRHPQPAWAVPLGLCRLADTGGVA